MEEKTKDFTVDFCNFTINQAKRLIKFLTDVVAEVEKDKAGYGEITYDSVMKSLYHDIDPRDYANWQNCTSKSQLDRLKAFNKLQNIAKYLNGKTWRPDFSKPVNKNYMIIRVREGEYSPFETSIGNSSSVIFKNEELAKRAIGIMGAEELEKLYNSNW